MASIMIGDAAYSSKILHTKQYNSNRQKWCYACNWAL